MSSIQYSSGDVVCGKVFTDCERITMDGIIFINGENITDFINDLKEQVKYLKEQVKDLKEQVDILYYSPPSQGGPGYNDTKTHFESTSQGQI